MAHIIEKKRPSQAKSPHFLAVLFALCAAFICQGLVFAIEPTYSDFRDVFPQGSSFDVSNVNSTVYEAKSGSQVLGFCFMTRDFAPLQSQGYSGLINTLVGMDTSGMITGIKVIDHSESRMYSKDFEYYGPFTEQFRGKYKGDSFRVNQDIDGVTGATVSATAIAESVGESAKRVYSIMAGRY